MNTLEIGRPRKAIAFNRNIVYVILLAALFVGLYFAMPKFEWYKPQIKVSPDTDTLGLALIEIEINEPGTGLKSVSVSLNAGCREIPRFTGQYEEPVVQKNVTIDITPPTLELIADDPYINFGGAGIIVYKTSADAVSSGVKIGSYFFPGYKGQVKDPNAYMVFFAHPYNVSENEKAVLVATDKAGNIRQMKLSYTLKDVRYKKSTIPISDEFIQSKVAPLVNDVGARQQAPKEVFIKVNHDLRKENDEKIRLIGQKTADKMLWNGPFIQLSNSKVEANFADARTYIYHDQAIDTAYHLGFDLSVTKRYPVEAANSGVVSFAGDLGIYGNAIIIDHGLGLSSLYGHLSSIDVKVGDPIKQQQVIGKTGETGLAVGDHLHFATLLQGVPVLPKEWWDPKWINDNLTPKLDASATETAEEAKPARTAKANRKRRKHFSRA